MQHETKTQRGTGGLQREAQSPVEVKKQELRKEVEAIRRGHLTGGYCETEELQVTEKELYGILAKDLELAKEKHGYSPDPKFKHPEIRAIELELNGLSWKPKLVVADDSK